MASHWACARLQAQRERLALHTLGLAGFTTYLPRMAEHVIRRGRREESLRPLFPGYCFVLIVDHWWAIMRSPGVIGLILDGSLPARVPDGVIDELRRREQADGYIRLPKPRGLQRGDRVLIREGPFANLIAVYAGIMSGAPVLLALFGGEKRITMSKDAIVAV